MKINSLPSSNGPDDKEPRSFLQAMNCQMKTDKSFFGISNCLPVPTLWAEDYDVDDLFHDSGEELEFMQGFVHGDAELTLSSSHEHDSILWMSWPVSLAHVPYTSAAYRW